MNGNGFIKRKPRQDWEFKASKRFLHRSDLSLEEKAIVMILRSFASRSEPNPWPSKEALCRAACVSEKTLRGYLDSLRKKQVIDWFHERDEKGHIRNRYVFCEDPIPTGRSYQ